MIKMYGIKNCDTVKQATKFLQTQKIDFEFIDFRQTPINIETLQYFVDVVGWEKLINKRSTAYRQLSDDEKQNLTLTLVLEKPTMIKRPVLVTDNSVGVGFDKGFYQHL